MKHNAKVIVETAIDFLAQKHSVDRSAIIAALAAKNEKVAGQLADLINEGTKLWASIQTA